VSTTPAMWWNVPSVTRLFTVLTLIILPDVFWNDNTTAPFF